MPPLFGPEPSPPSTRRQPAGLLLLVALAAPVTLCACGGSGYPDEGSEAAISGAELPPLPPRSASQRFTDVTAAAGVQAFHRLPTPELTNIVDAVGAGAAFADLDGDGWLDLVVLGGPRSPATDRRRAEHGGLRIYRNLRNGRFEDITRRSGVPRDGTAVAVAIGDIDGDGHRDLYLVDRGPNRLYRNLGTAVFDDITRKSGVGDPRFGIGAIFFDMDRDGDLDLYLANYLEFDPSDTHYFSPDGFPSPLAYNPQPDVLYRNRGDGTFEDVSSSFGIGDHVARGMSLAAADFDDDGDTDVFVANDATENFLFVNQGGMRFSEEGFVSGVAMGENGEQTSAMAADVGDVDGDGQLDLAVSDTAFGALYRRVSPGFFVDEGMQFGVGVLCGQFVSWGQNFLDFDNDGDLDLFVVNGGLHHLVGWQDLLLRNDGAGRFEDASDDGGRYFQERHVGRGSVTGDYDNDGDIDLFVTNLQGRPTLLRNDASGDHSWITLDLVGTELRDPVGTRVELQAGGRTFIAEHRFSTAYLGQSDPRLHFGLGEVDSVDRIQIRWPDGTLQTLTGTPTRRILRIQEGAE
jgi:enediyne biosynthesis protein E4